MSKKKRDIKSSLSGKSPYWWAGIIVMSLVLLLLVLELTNVTHIFHKHKVPEVINTASGTGSTSKDSRSTETGVSTAPGASSSSSSSKTPSSTGGSSQNQPLVAPYGDFVSNHHPSDATGLDEVSICNSTPGASCLIKFTNGQISTQLPAQTIGSDGSTSWSWNIKDAYLTSGEWQITAIATLSGQSKSTDDQLKLVVQ